MTHVYGWLAEQSSEDALHAERLLFIEERPFQRITRRLLGEESIVRPKQLPSPPPEAAEDEAVDDGFARRKFKEDVLVDFAALESSIMRIQLIQSSNERERERYASEKAKILATSQAVRDNTAQLREQLSEAQRILELRKGYDALAAKILDDRKLKSRDESRADIAALEKDIAELEAESKDQDEVWETRRHGFEELVGHGQAYLRAVKGIKEQPEEEDEIKLDSNAATPFPDGMSTPLPEISQEDEHQPSKLRESDDAQMEDAPDVVVSEPVEDDAGAGEEIKTEAVVDENITAEEAMADDNIVAEAMDET